MVINLAQINMARSIVGMNELRTRLDTSPVDVMMIQEPYYRGFINYPGGRVFYGAKPEEEVWTLTILFNTDISVCLLDQYSNTTATVLKAVYRNVEFILANCYFKFSEETSVHVTYLDNILRGFPGEIVIVSADVNAKSIMWHCDHTDSRCEMVEDLIASWNLEVMNIESELTTYESVHGAQSNLDITLVTRQHSRRMVNWRICDDVFISDHRR